MNTWFVATVNRLPGEAHFSFIWSMQEFESESAAGRYAKDALNKGLRVEAGTLPGPQIRIPWREAAAWAASSEAGRPDRESGRGLVTLHGVVDRACQRSYAEAIACRVPGVIDVRNEIAIRASVEFSQPTLHP